MGEIADGIINGDFDYISGEWLGEGDGFPRTLEHVRHINTNVDNRDKSVGIRVYLRKNGIRNEDMSAVVRRYFVQEMGRGKNKKLNQMCAAIQDDNFFKFKKWFDANYKK